MCFIHGLTNYFYPQTSYYFLVTLYIEHLNVIFKFGSYPRILNEVQETADLKIKPLITNCSITDHAHCIYSPFTGHPTGAMFCAGHRK